MAGNANSGRRDKPFLDAIRLEIAENSQNPRALRNIARQLIAQAEAGEGWAIKEFADRLDGKPMQQFTGILELVSQEDALAELDGQPAETPHERPEALN